LAKPRVVFDDQEGGGGRGVLAIVQRMRGGIPFGMGQGLGHWLSPRRLSDDKIGDNLKSTSFIGCKSSLGFVGIR
jgi:hypothetical protein